MDIQARLAEAESRFNTLQTERQEHLKQAEDCLTEMTKLQGEWRLLQELSDNKQANKQVDTVEAVPEEA